MLFCFQKIILIDCKDKSVTDLTAGELIKELNKKAAKTCQVLTSIFFL